MQGKNSITMVGLTKANKMKLFSFVIIHMFISYNEIAAQIYGSPVVLDSSFNGNEDHISAFSVPLIK